MEALVFINKLVRVRKHILKLSASQKNKAKCYSIIKNIEATTQAYCNLWENDSWIRFLNRKQEEFVFLIPENNRESYLNELKNILNEK